MEGSNKQHLAPQARLSILGDLNARRNSLGQGGKNSAKKKLPKSIELPQFSEKVKKLAKKMLFKVKMYLMLNRAKRKVQSYQDMMNPGYTRLIRVLQNPFRSTASAEFILDYIKTLSFFGNFIRDLGDVDDSAIVELCKCLKYEYIPIATCIFKENDISNDKFYVILKGSVSFVKKKDANIIILDKEDAKSPDEIKTPAEIKSPAEIRSPLLGAELKSPADKRTSIMPTGKIMHNEDSVDDTASQPNESAIANSNPELLAQTSLINLVASLGIKVGEMHEGEGFGEKALLAKNSKRTASVVTNTNCDFIILSKKDYIEIITKFDKRSQAKMKFMKSCIPHLNSITSSEIWSNLFYLVREVDYSKGIILGAEGQSGKNIYFINDGYCDLEKTIIVNRTKLHQKVEPLKIKRKLATFGSGSCLGEEILIGEDPKYEYNIVVSSIMAKIYIIDRPSFLKRFPWETVHAVIEAFKSKQAHHKEKIQKFAESIDASKFEQTKQSITVQTDHLSQLMRPAMRASMANHIKSMVNKEKIQERGQSVDSSLLKQPHEPPGKPSPLQKAESTRLFMRGSLQNFHADRSFNSYQSKGTPDLNGTLNSQQTDQKGYDTDEINMEEPNSAAFSSRRQTNFSENFRVSPTFFNRRIETANPEAQRSNKRLLTIGGYENSQERQERKSQFYVEEASSPMFEKFDFGTPSSATTKSQFRRTFIKTDSKEQLKESQTPTLKEGRRLFTASRDTPTTDSMVSDKEKRMFGKLRLGSRARTRFLEAQTPSSNPSPTIKYDDLITITTTEGTPKALSPGLPQVQKFWSVDEGEQQQQQRPKSHFSKQNVRIIELGIKGEAERSKESLKFLLKNSEEVKKNTSKGTIKDKRRILDSLNTRKQKEKFNIKTMKSVTPNTSIPLQKIPLGRQGKYQFSMDAFNT